LAVRAMPSESGAQACGFCEEVIPMNTENKPVEKTPVSGMTLTLAFEDRVLLRIDAWYLVLSAILRAEPPFNLNQALRESILTAAIEIGGKELVFGIPQPPEFMEDK